VSQNIASVRAAYDALARDGVEGIMPFLDEGIEWRNPEESPIAGVWHGPQGVREWFAQAQESFAEMRFTAEDFIQLPDGRVVVLTLGVFRGNQSGVAVEVPGAQIVTLRDGLVTRSQLYVDRHRALEAAGLQTD
jgi:ketosteroid isomerase-like protein